MELLRRNTYDYGVYVTVISLAVSKSLPRPGELYPKRLQIVFLLHVEGPRPVESGGDLRLIT